MGSNCQSMGEYVLLTEKQQQKWKKNVRKWFFLTILRKKFFAGRCKFPNIFVYNIHSLELGYEETKEMCWIGKQL